MFKAQFTQNWRLDTEYSLVWCMRVLSPPWLWRALVRQPPTVERPPWSRAQGLPEHNHGGIIGKHLAYHTHTTNHTVCISMDKRGEASNWLRLPIRPHQGWIMPPQRASLSTNFCPLNLLCFPSLVHNSHKHPYFYTLTTHHRLTTTTLEDLFYCELSSVFYPVNVFKRACAQVTSL